MSLTLEPMVIGPVFLTHICDISRRLLYIVFWRSWVFYDFKTMGLNPLDAAPGYMPILEYQWYGSTGTCPPSDCTMIAFFKKNLCKIFGVLYDTRPS